MYAIGLPAGALFDKGYFRYTHAAGSIIYVFWYFSALQRTDDALMSCFTASSWCRLPIRANTGSFFSLKVSEWALVRDAF